MCSRPNQYHRHSINCIIPPHMLEVVAMRGDASMRKMANTMLKQSSKVREERASQASGSMVEVDAPRGLFVSVALAATPQQHSIDREIYDGENKAALPGKLVRKEGDGPTGDDEVDRAYDGAGDVYDLYSKEYQRDSLDGDGMKLVATVHHRRKYNNAFWDGTQMAYGDGDGVLFKTFTEPSVVAHEMSHGVVQFSGGLVYQGQSGALNESFADVFGALSLQRKHGQTASQASWLIGEGILGPDINGVALRSMKAPGTAYSDAVLGKDPQPYHMDLFVNTTGDNGGVHINSGIPNHAFYLYAQYIGGNAWEVPGQIWYKALQKLNNPMATFTDWAAQTLDAAIDLHGLGSIEMVMLRRAWRLVGIGV
ncbi:MAG: M4 family metallopeptidase [Ahrensia sp.]|nr:M4 family metallopeptidase [Ahrensia sp.]